MAGPQYIVQADLEQRFRPDVVKRVFSDDGGGVAGPRLDQSARAASRQADAVLLKAWTVDQVPLLVAEDEAVWSAVCELAMAHGTEGKPEWSGDGAPFEDLRRRALEMLEMLAKAQLRSRGEAVAGANPNVKGSVSSVESPAFMFAPSRGRPKPGGF
jgi:hypothetical protein